MHARIALAIIVFLAAMCLVAIAALLSNLAAAQATVCGSLAEIEAVLAKRYGEAKVGHGVSGDGKTAYSLYRSAAGTWTIVAAIDATNACMMAGGEAWDDFPFVAPGTERGI